MDARRTDAENLQWLRALPHGPVSLPEFPEVQLVHGSPNDEDEYVVSLGDALAPLITLTMPLTFFGHTHLQGGFFANGSSADGFRPEYRTVGQAESVPLQLKRSARYLINPGSVGQPRDGDWRAAFALYDTEAQVVHFHRTPYNLKAGAGPHLRGEASSTTGDAARRRTLITSVSSRGE